MDLFKWALIIAVLLFVTVCSTSITTKGGFSIKVEYWQEWILILMVVYGAIGLYVRGRIGGYEAGAKYASERVIDIINDKINEN